MGTDPQPGPGWWLASDGKWYPPESHPNRATPLPPPPLKAYMPPSVNPYYVQGPHNVPEAVSRGARERLSMRAWVTIAVCFLYIFSPLDLLPEEFLGPLGIPDDLVALTFLLRAARSGSKD